MSDPELIDACLRVVSNRCRNLRKAVEKAKSWQQAIENGAQLNDEQLESIRSLPRKQALIDELTAILKKQTSILQPQLDKDASSVSNGSKLSKGHQSLKDKDVKLTGDMNDKTTFNSTVNQSTTSPCLTRQNLDVPTLFNGNATPPSALSPPHGSSISHDSKTLCELATQVTTDFNKEVETPIDVQTLKRATGESYGTSAGTIQPILTTSTSSGNMPSEQPPHLNLKSSSLHFPCINSPSSLSNQSLPSNVLKALNELEEKRGQQLCQSKTDTIRAVLNLFHVTDFLKQPGSRDSLLSFFANVESPFITRPVTSLDIDLVCYFNIMLTTPNGNIAHDEAVDISTAHCLEYLNCSASEAFKGTSYATLREIVTSIETCPIMADRGNKVTTSTHRVRKTMVGSL